MFPESLLVKSTSRLRHRLSELSTAVLQSSKDTNSSDKCFNNIIFRMLWVTLAHKRYSNLITQILLTNFMSAFLTLVVCSCVWCACYFLTWDMVQTHFSDVLGESWFTCSLWRWPVCALLEVCLLLEEVWGASMGWPMRKEQEEPG